MIDQSSLLNGDLLRLSGLRLRNDDAENAILEAGLDIVVVDWGWEGEGAMVLANRAFSDPVATGILRFLLHLLFTSGSYGRLSLLGALTLVFDGRLVRLLLALNEALRWRTTLRPMFGAAGDREGIRALPLDVDILLLDAGELAVKFIGLLGLFDIEAWLEAGYAFEGVAAELASSTVVLVQDSEHGREVRSNPTWEKRHLCCGVEWGFVDSFDQDWKSL